jgi:hypothetical protein
MLNLLIVLPNVVCHIFIFSIYTVNNHPVYNLQNVKFINILYIQLQTMKYTNYIINCNTVLYPVSIPFQTIPTHTISTLLAQ